ncbi:MAG: leucine-rich repeat domain-containing protein, partial [Clostridia bacterium]|nr:leucine-rich repeat domain-containing protein [Clostridia bacterium]
MNKLFKVWAILTSCVLIAAVGGLVACDNDNDGQQATSNYTLEYTLSDDGTYYSVTSCSGNPAAVTIQATYSGLPVTEIGSMAFYEITNLKSVTIPDSVIKIGYQAFYKCTSLSSITLPDSVVEISKEAFSDTAYYN